MTRPNWMPPTKPSPECDEFALWLGWVLRIQEELRGWSWQVGRYVSRGGTTFFKTIKFGGAINIALAKKRASQAAKKLQRLERQIREKES